MPRVRRRGRGRQTDLDIGQHFELTIGPDDHRPAFKSPFTRRAAWFMHKDDLLAAVNEGTRPWAFYEFELKEHPPQGFRAEQRFLEERALLTDEEKAQIAAWESLKGA